MSCKSCGYSNSEGASKCPYCGSNIEVENASTPKPAFITSGDVFDIRGELVVMGISLDNLKTFDTIKFGNQCFTIQEITVMNGGCTNEVSTIEQNKNCALNLGKFKKENFKKLFNDLIIAEQGLNKKPIYFSSTPTSNYIWATFK